MTTTEAPTTTINAPLLLRAMKNALPFAERSNYLQILNAVRIQADGVQLTIDATDRYKLLRQKIAAPGVEFGSVLLALRDAKRMVQELTGALRATPKTIRDRVGANLTCDGARIEVALEFTGRYSYQLSDLGQFPAVERLLTTDLKPTADVAGLNADHLSAFGACRVSDDPKVYTTWKVTTYGDKPTRWLATSKDGLHILEGLLMVVREP